MALISQIEPVTIFNQTGIFLCCDIIHYDLVQTSCEVSWWLLNQNESQIYANRWFVPADILATWGTDDSVIIEGLATELGFTIVTS